MIGYRLMIQFTKDETQPNWHGYFYTVMFFVNALVLSLFLHQYFHRVNLTGMRIRTAIIAAVYNKVHVHKSQDQTIASSVLSKVHFQYFNIVH